MILLVVPSGCSRSRQGRGCPHIQKGVPRRQEKLRRSITSAPVKVYRPWDRRDSRTPRAGARKANWSFSQPASSPGRIAETRGPWRGASRVARVRSSASRGLPLVQAISVWAIARPKLLPKECGRRRAVGLCREALPCASVLPRPRPESLCVVLRPARQSPSRASMPWRLAVRCRATVCGHPAKKPRSRPRRRPQIAGTDQPQS